jgi:hypothetical protein
MTPFDFEYYTVSFDGADYWKHTTLATMQDDCTISFEMEEPERINWNELNQVVDEWLEDYENVRQAEEI